jgi:hypothetical protein
MADRLVALYEILVVIGAPHILKLFALPFFAVGVRWLVAYVRVPFSPQIPPPTGLSVAESVKDQVEMGMMIGLGWAQSFVVLLFRVALPLWLGMILWWA